MRHGGKQPKYGKRAGLDEAGPVMACIFIVCCRHSENEFIRYQDFVLYWCNFVF